MAEGFGGEPVTVLKPVQSAGISDLLPSIVNYFSPHAGRNS
jgi:hypothetical protein